MPQPTSEPVILPLVYVSRSGSTMLVRYAARHLADVVVLPETRWLELLLVAGDAALRNMGAEELLALMERDPRVVEMLGGDEAAREFAAEHAGAPMTELLLATGRVLAERRGKDLRFLLVKHGELLDYVPLLTQRFARVEVVFAVRDPRGAAVSPFANQRVTGARLTPGVILRQALRWRTYVQRVRRLEQAGVRVHRVVFEEMVPDPVRQAASLAAGLGARFEADPPARWEFQLPSRDTRVHRKLYKPPDVSRIDAWKRELAPHLGVVVERATLPQMLEMGYEPWFLPRASTAEVARAMGVAVADLVEERAAHGVSWTRRVMRQPSDGVWRLRTAWRRMLGRLGGR